MRKILCLVLAMLFLCLSGCTKNDGLQNGDELSQTTKITELSLLYCVGDTINPYTAVTNVNTQLCQLLFEPLIKVSNNFTPEYFLAQGIELSGTQCTVTLKPAKFSDGSDVTAQDVVYSFNLAKQSTSIYATQLSDVKSAEISGGSTVVFNLRKADPYFANLLDFPILKTNSDTFTDSDGVLLAPIGCGRYVIDEAAAVLTPNQNYYGTFGGITKINLINAPDSESVSHYVEVGATDIYYTDLSDGNIMRMSGKRFNLPLNNLVYIGINQNYAPLSNLYLRNAISSAVNRDRIVTSAYYGNAVTATGIFHPNFADAAKYQTLQNESNPKISIENLEKIGYNGFDSQNFRVDSNGVRLSLTLLVNSENQSRVLAANTIADQLSDVGIFVSVQSVPYEQYIARLNSGDFQLYLGETRILNNMDITQLVVPGGSAAYGVTVTATTDTVDTADGENTPSSFSNITDIINGFYSGNNSIADIVTCAQAQMPIIPICYRNGILFYSEQINANMTASLSDIFYSINLLQ